MKIFLHAAAGRSAAVEQEKLIKHPALSHLVYYINILFTLKFISED
jgi:hypothetical protein